MKQSIDILRGRPWLLLLVLFAWLMPQRASADTYVDSPNNYTVMLGGSNIVYFTAPVYDMDLADCWVQEGKLKVSVEDGAETTIFTWKSTPNIDNDKTELSTYFSTTADGFFDITRGNSRNTFRLTKNNPSWVTLTRNGDGETFDFGAEWVVPYNMLGKKLTFTWDVTRNGNGRTEEKVTKLKTVTINIPAASAKLTPFLSNPMMEPSNPGKLELPWFLPSDNITKAYWEYKDTLGNTYQEDINNVSSGIIMLDANVPYRNLRVVCNYMEQGDKGEYEIEGVASQTMNVPMIHAPVGLTVRPLGDQKAKVELTWSVPYPEDEDLVPTDFFEIQRSLTGKEEDFQTISQAFYATTDKKTIYTFIDSTVVEALEANMLEHGGTLGNLTYRVRRSVTQDWGWGPENNCATTATCIIDNLHLLRIANYSAKWEDEQARTVRVAWEYADEYAAVWDERARMMLRVISKNRDGAIVDSLTYTLDENERAQRYTVVNLTRSCVYYDIDMYVERGESPVNHLDQMEEYFYPIRSEADWTTFCEKVANANGQDINACLYADITVSQPVGSTSGAPYRGVFKGNGHTLTFNKSNWTGTYCAPFQYVANATISELHTAGNITTTYQYAGGLIAYIVNGSNVAIENCRSSMTINSSQNTNGGFVARLGDNSTVVLRNCKFDGSFEGAGHHNGGFIGYCQDKSSVTIDNCLFAPDHYTAGIAGCRTWARGGDFTLNVTNSHATHEFTDQIESMVIDGKTFMVLKNEDDWLKFRDAVDKNSNTNAIMVADFTVHNTVALADGKFFSGIFDGNGHTITAEINGGSLIRIGLFGNCKHYTIKNLHLKGTITGGEHIAALVGFSTTDNGSTHNYITNCRVSAKISYDKNENGGFVGWSTAPHTITNCLFDGTFSHPEGLFGQEGAFIGWQRDYGNDVITNCLENGTYTASIIGLNLEENFLYCKPYGNVDDCKNNWTYHSWDHANQVGSKSAEDMVKELGSANWQVVDGKVVPKMASTEVIGIVTRPLSDFENYYAEGWTKEGNTINPATTTAEYHEYATIVDPNLKGLFYQTKTGKMDPKLLTTTRQSSVLLAWNTDNNPIDYFQVMRRVKGEDDSKWQEIANYLDQMSYEDTSVSPLLTYEYQVIGVNQCEGIVESKTDPTFGECKHTGRVEGYVRFNDGTGAPDIEVAIEYKNNKVTSVMTDESGYFEVDELSYQGGTSVDYSVAPVGKSGIHLDPVEVTFDAASNNATVREFTITTGRRFSGYVMYDGTSIPVKGVNFLVNGKKIHNAKGDFVETDYDGSFSFRVLEGSHTIQAVMDNHVFTNDGWYKNSGKQNITADVAGIYFYDSTKVTLTGRVVGGDDQGKKPLLNNLSKNNLGDSLTVVLTLEGDNTSWLVYDNQNPNRTQREEVVPHPRNGQKHYTTVLTQRKRMVVTPDLTTGEYMLMLPPVRWKVQQVYCKGYPTLFQEGQVSEVVDLTKCLTPRDTTYLGIYRDVDTARVENPTAQYHAVYNRIYHSPVEVTYKQLGYDNFDYFGDKTYAASELTGTTTQVPLVYSVRKPNWPENRKDSLQAVYTLGHPVFSVERRYNIQLQVGERYQYNNDPASGAPDLVPLTDGVAYMQNGMRAFSLETLKEPQMLDSLGRAFFTLKADQTTNMANSLKTVTFTVMRDSTYIQAEPLQGYVLNMFPVGESQDILTEGAPILYDILRDPPGAYSTNTLAKGATINYTYMMNLAISAGLFINVKYGTKMEVLSGHVQAVSGPVIQGAVVGPISANDNVNADIDMLMYNGNGSKAFSHTMVVGNNISTSGDPSMVGADADLYIGSVQNVVVTPMSTIRVVTNDMLMRMIAQLGKDNIVMLTGSEMDSEVGKNIDYGTVTVIASGKNAKGEPIHLIRDVALGYGPKLQSNFIYSQKQLLTQIIPNKAKEITDMMFIGTKDEAQAIADRTKRPVYLSLRMPTDSTFAVVNSKDKLNGHIYNDTIDVAQDGINYLVVIPSDKKAEDFSDEVAEKYQVIKAWVDMIAKNEAEKLQARDLLTNYDVAGAAGVNYSETFDASYSESWSNFFPMVTEVDYFGLGKGVSNVFSIVGIGGSIASAIGLSLQEMKTWSKPSAEIVTPNWEHGTKSTVTFAGKTLQWSLFPVASYTSVGADSEARSYNRTESFTIATDPSSHLNVDVYRAWYDNTDKDEEAVYNVFTNDNFNTYYGEVSGQVQQSLKSVKINGPRSFIFRTRGGATQNPWEDERVTKFYDPGTVLDARTLKICNPKIRLDKQSESGVAIDDAAHFTVYVSNDSEKPEATDGLSVLQVFVPDQMNPQGAKISINGQTLTTGGMTVTAMPGAETALEMEVRAGKGFDFENLVIGVMSPTDPEHTYDLTTFDVHFLREAGGVNIATPGDKWVLNTMAQMDSKRGWYLPVTINGFDRHQHNFDHIEFQYKESQRGDDSWTNLCSFYADATLMAGANGVRKLIPENGNIVTEFFGEGWTMERSYDLRAVLFCRNGNDFLTTSSKIITGIKDTRRPQLFGTPEPKSGVLNAGDDIVFNFSEDIEYNYLSAITNFEVKGEVNNNSLSDMVSVQFSGQASVESEAKRNFSGKDLTIDLMVKPAETNRDMPLFSHGTNGQKLQLWLTKDFKLMAVVGDQTFTSDAAIEKDAFQQVAMVLNQTDSLLTLYHGGVEIGRHKLSSLYTGTGTLIFGRTNESDRSQSQYYEGRMMEARLWYSAMDGGLIGSTYGGHHLTGYEKNLVDYYPMNEGSGDYVKDYTQGANAKLVGASWAVPQGLSLKLEKTDKGVRLDKNAMNRTAEQDYTLMFWFKTDAEGRGTLLSNGRGLSEDNGAKNQFHIGFEDNKLMYRSNGFGIEVPGDWSDGKWHNYAMTVNRGRGVANIYMDKELVTTFETDTLGGISGGYPLIGASRYDVINKNDTLLNQEGLTPLKGNVDELMFFAQALPQQLIQTYTTKSPNGDEAGLLTYLSFDRQERQKDNSIELVPYAYSKKLYLDDKGKPRYQLDPLTKEPTDTLVRDYLFVDEMDVVVQHFDAKDAAPVVPYEEVTNLKFSFIGRGNQILVELDEPKAKLNHRNIYVTLRDIEDLNGNTTASPQTACYYVTNSSLQWLVNRLDVTVKYGSGESQELPFYNYGAQSHTYTIENCPRWLTLNKYGDVMAPESLDYITAEVSKDLNVGTYNEIIYLVDEEGITEPFYLNLIVEGEQPEWANKIDGELLGHSMSISGQVYLYGELDTDARDIVGVFDKENKCHGFANISHDVQSGENGLYLTVFNDEESGQELNFRLWQYSTGREIVLTPEKKIIFQASTVLGVDKPIRFEGNETFVQNFHLKRGWNWVSFNVTNSDQLGSAEALLSSMSWNEGDIITDLNDNLTLAYTNGKWISTKDTTDIIISPKRGYAIKVQEDCNYPVSGRVVKNEEDRTIVLNPGWNGIGYTPMTNLTVATALSDYFDQAEEGDVIKSHTEFAYFTKSGNNGRWRGSLQYMKPGEGYMMLRNADKEASFTYPFYELNSNFREDWTATTAQAPMRRSTMTVSTTIAGFEPQDGDLLLAYVDGEVVGREALRLKGEDRDTDEDQPVCYLSIGGDDQKPIWFAIERDGEIVASTNEVMTFKANAVIGSPDVPTSIDFTRIDTEGEGKWYTVSGVQLQQKPTRKGVYIYNGKKVLIK